MKTAIILISEAGLSIAQSLLNELPDSEIFTLRHEELSLIHISEPTRPY